MVIYILFLAPRPVQEDGGRHETVSWRDGSYGSRPEGQAGEVSGSYRGSQQVAAQHQSNTVYVPYYGHHCFDRYVIGVCDRRIVDALILRLVAYYPVLSKLSTCFLNRETK